MSLWIPCECPRGRNDCEALATIKSDCGKSFICSGLNDGTTRQLKQDRFTFCFKNEETDEMTHNDEQDMRDMLSIIAQALSADWHIKQNKEINHIQKLVFQKFHVKDVESHQSTSGRYVLQEISGPEYVLNVILL